MRRLVILIAATAIAGSGHAQTAPTPTDGLGGPAIAGVCLLSRQAVLTNAKVGVAATARLRDLTEQAQAEISTDRNALERDIRAFTAEAPKLTEDQKKMRQQALQTKLQPIEAKAAQRQREIEATREKAVQRISIELQPVVAQIYKQRNCGLLLERSSVIGGNMTNDLTQAVTQGLDAKISTITFDREVLPPATPAPTR